MGNKLNHNNNLENAYGCIPEHYDHNDKRLYISKNKVKQIEDYREVDISKLYPPVQNQKALNTSTAIHVADTIVYEQNKLKQDVYVPSYLFIYYLYNIKTNIINGASIRDTLIQVNKHGIIEENYTNHFDKVLEQEYKKLRFRNEFTFKKVPRNLDYFKACLVVLKRGIIFGFSVYESFFQIMKWDNDGMMPTPKVPEKRLGIQTGICVGYSEQKKAFLIRNSWGPRWKKNGYFFMPFDYIMSKNCDYFWVFYFRTEGGDDKRRTEGGDDKRRRRRKSKKKTNISSKRFMPSFPPLVRRASLIFSDTDDEDNKKSKSKSNHTTKRQRAPEGTTDEVKIIGIS